MNTSASQRFPLWYTINDTAIVLFSFTTIFVGITFVLLVARERKLLAMTTVWDAFHMLKADMSGLAREDRHCVLRNICMLITMAALNYSLCIQTYHRFITIVHCHRASLRSMHSYVIIIFVQWFASPLLMLPIILSGKVVYQPGSFLCQISFSNTGLFSYLFVISYGIPVVFIVAVHLRIAHHINNHWRTHRKRVLSGKHLDCPAQRIVLIISVLIISCSSCGLFFILEQLQITVVPYAQKVVLLFASLSFALTMILTFKFNRSVRNSSLLSRRQDQLIIRHIVYRSARKSAR